MVVTALSVAGSFGIARLIFQGGYLAEVHNSTTPQLHNSTSPGFVGAHGPLFFAAMGFGVSTDYTFFLLSAAKERYKTHPVPSGRWSAQLARRVVLWCRLQR